MLTYLQRDRATRDGERGRLYGPHNDHADGRAFTKRGRDDRHQFRFIVAPEDGDRLADLRGFIRDLMRQMEEDLGTRLDWIAADHFNTGHAHGHVVVRGHDDLCNDLIIAQDYVTDGMRLRAQQLVTRELGPETDLELRTKLQAEVSADRFTRIDRAMLAEANDQFLDLRPEAGQAGADFDRSLRLGRLQKRSGNRAFGSSVKRQNPSCDNLASATTSSRGSTGRWPNRTREGSQGTPSFMVRRSTHQLPAG